MNKYKKAEARRVKNIVRVMKACGCTVNYRAVRRKIRSYDRSLASIPKIIHDGFRHLNYGVAEVARRISSMIDSAMFAEAEVREKLGLRADSLIIDESTAVADTPMWPKVNPYDPRLSGVQILRSDGFIKVVTPDD